MFWKVLRHVFVPSSDLEENNIKGAFSPVYPKYQVWTFSSALSELESRQKVIKLTSCLSKENYSVVSLSFPLPIGRSLQKCSLMKMKGDPSRPYQFHTPLNAERSQSNLCNLFCATQTYYTNESSFEHTPEFLSRINTCGTRGTSNASQDTALRPRAAKALWFHPFCIITSD